MQNTIVKLAKTGILLNYTTIFPHLSKHVGRISCGQCAPYRTRADILYLTLSGWLCNMHCITTRTYMALYSTTMLLKKTEVGSSVYEVKSSQLMSVTTQFRLICNFSAHSPTWLSGEIQDTRYNNTTLMNWHGQKSMHTITQCFKCSYINLKVIFVQVRWIFG